jgi:hypothetical protein
MAKFQGGDTFAPGQTVDDVRLNNLVNMANALTGLISEQALITSLVPGDQLLVYQLSDASGFPKRASLSDIITGVKTVIFNNTWPVGSIFISVLATNPSTLLGGGTWVQFGQGRCLVGQFGADPDFAGSEQMGGAKTVALATSNLPSHTHDLSGHTHDMSGHTHFIASSGSTNTTGAHTHATNTGGSILTTGPTSRAWAAGSGDFGGDALQLAGNHSHTVNTTGTTGAPTPAATAGAVGTSGATGSGAGFSIQQQYIVAYFWKRTA